MVDDLRITVLAENTVRGSGLLAEHGMAFWIEVVGHRILLDTGQGKVLRPNAQQLGVPLEEVESVVLSHGHYDHTGGLRDVLDMNRQASVWLHPAALASKYYREKTPPHRNISAPRLDEPTLGQLAGQVHWTRGPTEVSPRVYLTGEIPRDNEIEDTGGPFYLDEACTVPDPLLDDQALYIETAMGLVVMVGCAHAGVINTLDYVAHLTDRKQVYAVLGGMHLLRATPERLDATVATLRRYDVQKVGAAHCTGMRAMAYLWSQLPDQCIECSVGTQLTIGASETR